MTDQEVARYKEDRFQRILSFYDRKSRSSKLWHRLLSAYVIVVSSIIPVVIATGVIGDHKVIGGLASATIVAATAWAAHAQFHENWLRYRRAWDGLMREEALYSARASSYSDADRANCLFVEQVEGIIAGEGENWEARNTPAPSSAQKGSTGGC